MKEKYYTRFILYPNDTIEEIKVLKKSADKEISLNIKKDKEILDLLKKL